MIPKSLTLWHATVCLLAFSSSPLLAEQPALQRFHFQKALMGTKFQIILYSTDKKKAQQATEAAFLKAQQVEDACSDYNPNSELSKLMKPPASQEISPLLADVLRQALSIAKETHGAFDPTLGGHSRNWRRAKTRGVLPSPKEITYARETAGWKNLTLSEKSPSAFIATKKFDHMQLDLGGIAKGYAADRMLEILKQHGISIATIAAGGDVRLGDPPPGKKGWRVGLKILSEPNTENQQTKHYITASNCAVSTSGDLHQFVTIEGQRYSHIVDPATGLGLIKRSSATVIAPTSTRADALATACCVNPSATFSLLEKIPATHTLIVSLNSKGTTTQIISSHFPKMEDILN